jgi:mono/diheme cytochrome c family protein
MRAVIPLMVFLVTGVASGQETKVTLIDARGKAQTQACGTCHSLDYIQMNSRFLDKAGWTGSINKMINAFSAPIPKEDIEAIASYLAQNYGKSSVK